MHGQTHGGNAHVKKCAFYAWEKMRIIYVGKKPRMLCMGKPTVGMPTLEMRDFMRGKKMRII